MRRLPGAELRWDPSVSTSPLVPPTGGRRWPKAARRLSPAAPVDGSITGHSRAELPACGRAVLQPLAENLTELKKGQYFSQTRLNPDGQINEEVMDFSSGVSGQNLTEAEVLMFPSGEHRRRESLALLTAAHPSPRGEASISEPKPPFFVRAALNNVNLSHNEHELIVLLTEALVASAR